MTINLLRLNRIQKNFKIPEKKLFQTKKKKKGGLASATLKGLVDLRGGFTFFHFFAKLASALWETVVVGGCVGGGEGLAPATHAGR